MDTNFLWNAALTVGMGVISCLGWMGKNLLGQIKTALEARMQQHEEQIGAINQKVENTQESLNEYKIIVQRKFVNQAEYIRTTQGLDAKIDRVLSEINKININVARIATTQEVKENGHAECTEARR